MNALFVKDLIEKPQYIKFIEHIVNKCSDEFFPPLAGRTGTQQKDLKWYTNGVHEIGVSTYVEQLLKQENIFVVSDDKIVGFMSFIHNCHEATFDAFDGGANNFISTICVEPKFRRCGAAKKLYDFIEQKLPSALKADFTSTRTWSENHAHLSLLDARGYTLVYRIIDDREYQGQRADSAYYAKKNNK